MKLIALAKFLAFTILAGAMLGCSGSHTSDAPPLIATPAEPEQKSWIDKTGDAAGAAWDAVAKPVGGLIPKPKPKPAPAEVVPSDPPEMVIISPENRGLTTEEPKK